MRGNLDNHSGTCVNALIWWDIVFAVVIIGLIVVGIRWLLPNEITMALIQHAPWPVVTAGCILLFQRRLGRILDELAAFIKRSFYRNGEGDITDPSPDAIPINGDIEDGDALLDPITKKIIRGNSAAEREAFEKIKEEYGVVIHESKSIGASNYYFDGVMEYRGRLYGIEIKGNANMVMWERLFANVQKAYDGFTDEQRRRFTLLVCIRSATTEKDIGTVLAMADRQKYTVILKTY